MTWWWWIWETFPSNLQPWFPATSTRGTILLHIGFFPSCKIFGRLSTCLSVSGFSEGGFTVKETSIWPYDFMFRDDKIIPTRWHEIRHYGMKGLVLNIPWCDNSESVVTDTLHAEAEPWTATGNEELQAAKLPYFSPLVKVDFCWRDLKFFF